MNGNGSLTGSNSEQQWATAAKIQAEQTYTPHMGGAIGSRNQTSGYDVPAPSQSSLGELLQECLKYLHELSGRVSISADRLTGSVPQCESEPKSCTQPTLHDTAERIRAAIITVAQEHARIERAL